MVLGLALAGPAPAELPAPGHLLLIGGGGKPPSVLRRFVALAGGPEAPLVVLPTASGDPGTGAYYQELFAEYTRAPVTVLSVRRKLDAYRPEVVRALDKAGGIFFSGGDQARITAALLGTPAYRALRRALGRGAVVGGTSAGTACMSETMLSGAGDPAVLESGNLELVPGLGLWPGVILDQHFVARRRQNRLLSAVLEQPARLGVGIDEATAAWVKPDGTFEVLGEGSVWIFDARRAKRRNQGRTQAARDVRLDVLAAGDRFDPARTAP